MNRKEYLKKWREDNKEHIRRYKKEYAKTHDSSFKKLQDKYKQLEQENEHLKDAINKTIETIERFICTIEYIQVDGIAIAENYEKILKMLKEVSK